MEIFYVSQECSLIFVKFHVPEKTRLTLITGNYIYNHQLFRNISSLVIVKTETLLKESLFPFNIAVYAVSRCSTFETCHKFRQDTPLISFLRTSQHHVAGTLERRRHNFYVWDKRHIRKLICEGRYFRHNTRYSFKKVDKNYFPKPCRTSEKFITLEFKYNTC